MAKITVEDCLAIVPNRFQLVLLASNRARELQKGHTALVEVRPHEKATVTALREIAAGKLSADKIRQLTVR